MDTIDFVKIRQINKDENNMVRELIEEGLKEYFEDYDPSFNEDLEDIYFNYTKNGNIFLVAEHDGCIIGSGGFVKLDALTVQIKRMSVKKQYRSRKIGGRILKELESYAKENGFVHIIIETTASWNEAIGFYVKNVYKITGTKDGDVYFEKFI